MTDFRRYPKIRLNQPWDIESRVAISYAISGKLNVVGSLTLTPSVSQTLLSDPLITRASFIGLMPLTANAAAALTGLRFDPSASGSVLIHHANSPQTDRHFRYAILG